MTFNYTERFSNKRKFGFTLAEILITIGIIGVVAILVMPGLIEKHKKRVTISQLKKSYSAMSQAVLNSVQDNGDTSGWDTGLNGVNFMNRYLLKYLKPVKTLTGKNRYKVYTMSTQGNTYTNFIFWIQNANSYIYLLPDGSAIGYGWDTSNNVYLITIDVNGSKGPNVLGIDAFVYYIKDNKLLPDGFGLTRNQLLGKTGNKTRACKRDSSWQYYRGAYCGALLMMDGWEFRSDYPWDNGGKTKIPN